MKLFKVYLPFRTYFVLYATHFFVGPRFVIFFQKSECVAVLQRGSFNSVRDLDGNLILNSDCFGY